MEFQVWCHLRCTDSDFVYLKSAPLLASPRRHDYLTTVDCSRNDDSGDDDDRGDDDDSGDDDDDDDDDDGDGDDDVTMGEVRFHASSSCLGTLVRTPLSS